MAVSGVSLPSGCKKNDFWNRFTGWSQYFGGQCTPRIKSSYTTNDTLLLCTSDDSTGNDECNSGLLNLGNNPRERSSISTENNKGIVLNLPQKTPCRSGVFSTLIQPHQIPDHLGNEIVKWLEIIRLAGELVIANNSKFAITHYIVDKVQKGNRILYMRARIFPQHVGTPRKNFSNAASDARMIELDARSGDERGHILAHALGPNNNFGLNFSQII